jgi:holo-[acyl-carrier protein] synthase
MIYGIGTDVVKVKRMTKSLSRLGQSYAQNMLTDDEFVDYKKVKNQGKFLAKRFAAKEAFVKALGTGFKYPAVLKNITVTHDELGKPELKFEEDLQGYLDQNKIICNHVSIADENKVAIAFVVLTSKP